jgi:hypothetical protein
VIVFLVIGGAFDASAMRDIDDAAFEQCLRATVGVASDF